MLLRPTTIESVHRYSRASGRTGEAVAREYWSWLDGAWGPFVRVQVAAEGVCIFLFGLKAISLASADPGDYAVRGGLLARPGGTFRFFCTPEHAVAALLDFRPTLPHWLYRLSHGRAHEWTMRRFGRHLARLDAHAAERPA
jgi:hypothetical protein